MTRWARMKWVAFGITIGAALGAGTVTAITIGAERAEEQRMHTAIEGVAADVTELVNDGAHRQFGVTNQAGDRRVSTVDVDAHDCGAIAVSIRGEQPQRPPVTATLHLEPKTFDAEGCPSSFSPTLTIGD